VQNGRLLITKGQQMNPELFLSGEKKEINIPRLIAVNGDICSGSSTLAENLALRLGFNKLEAGELFRKITKRFAIIDTHRLSQAINSRIQEAIIGKSRLVIEGRLVGLQTSGYADVLKILCTANYDTRAKRYMDREGLLNIETARAMLSEREKTDNLLMQEVWNLSTDEIFRPELYDVVVDTSLYTAQELTENICKNIALGL